MSQTVAVTETTFQTEVIDSPVPVLVDFWADWCGPCKSLAPILDKLAEDFAGRLTIAKVNVDEQQQLAAMAGIRSLPTMMLFVDGRPVDQIVGAQPEANIRAVLERHVAMDSSEPANDPVSDALEDGSGDASLAQLQAILESDPDNLDAKLAIAQIHIVAGRLDEAGEILNALPEDAADNDKTRQVSAAHWFATESTALASDADASASAQQYRDAVAAVAQGEHDQAAEALLAVLASNRKFGDDAARKALLRLIDLLTPADERVGQLRRRMMTLIY
ncbi:MAG: thioredoxin [Pseudomonadota bacterium]